MIAAAIARWPDQQIADDNQADALWIWNVGGPREGGQGRGPGAKGRGGLRRDPRGNRRATPNSDTPNSELRTPISERLQHDAHAIFNH